MKTWFQFHTRELLVALMGLIGSSGCLVDSGQAQHGVGASCDPPHPAPLPNFPNCNGTGCYLASEVYLETSSPSCASRLCLVYRYDEFAYQFAEEERSKRVFCTQHCDAEQPCPQGFACVPIFSIGNQGVRGSYCVRENIAPTQPAP